LEGWWLQRLVAGLSQKSPLSINGAEIDAELNNLREQFKSDSLPIYSELRSTKPDISLFSNLVFIKQLRLINISEDRVKRAAMNFYKASVQRSRWVRESLLVNDELEQYDDSLKEEWGIRFDQSKEAMSLSPTDTEYVALGKKVYQWVETEAHIPIRPSCQEYFITRGSYQILADRQQVGWHPEFKSRLVGQCDEENL
jgi:hypothetical protein